ncbi:DNA cytosine methyltransferase [Leminorella grimontii]|uniref:DNA cytosine methyltransferase n=1 Tax=Leminorella grimontii TaxID=82981 RepID=UPI0032205936
MRGAYYNEIDPNAAKWLRNLIAAGHIAPGEVDERSIEDVAPDDLRGFTQCHFFAGIGVWSYALRLAGWPDNKPVWTGSCPCQPFSSAGKGAGFNDERHLWPALFHLIRERRPKLVFGEQVAGVNAWFDLVQTDVEAVDYAFGLVPFPAAGVGAPHIRDRAYWVADASSERSTWWRKRINSIKENTWREASVRQHVAKFPSRLCASSGLEHADMQHIQSTGDETRTQHTSWSGKTCGLVDADNPRLQRRGRMPQGPNQFTFGSTGMVGGPDPADTIWSNADWLFCRDGKWRPVESGAFPLAHGITSRVGRVRAYGNAIVAPAAAAFIRAFTECAGHDLI